MACSLLRRPRSSCFSPPALWSTNTDPLIYILSLSLSLKELFLSFYEQNHKINTGFLKKRTPTTEIQSATFKTAADTNTAVLVRRKHERETHPQTPFKTRLPQQNAKRKEETVNERKRERGMRRKLQQAATGYSGREPVKTCRNIGSEHHPHVVPLFTGEISPKKRNIFIKRNRK